MRLLELIKKNKTTIIMIFFFLLGLAILLYPQISSYISKKVQSKAINNYEEMLSKNFDVNYDDYFKEAEEYNKKLSNLIKPMVTYKRLGDASNILKLDNANMIGYIYIDKIKVDLPIYYGTDEKVLNVASGLLEGTSFPVGGDSVHSVLSAHRGLPSSALFTHLDKLEKGDEFVIKILNRTLTYEVDQILIVKPNEINNLDIINNKDYVTLMTCTPYGINTHRLLVRGKRVENKEIKKYVSTDAFKIDKLIVTPIACIPILLVWLISIAFKPLTNNKKIHEKYVYPNGKKYISKGGKV